MNVSSTILGVSAGFALFALVSAPAFAVPFGPIAGPPANDVDTDPATVVTLTVGQSGIITDLNLAVTIATNHGEDVDIFLRHVASGTQVQVKQTGGNHQNGIDVLLDDESANAYWGDTIDFNIVGTFRPLNPLSAFDGLQLAGDWELIILDDLIPNEGEDLTAWSLSGEVRGVPVPPAAVLVGLGLAGLWLARRRRPIG